MINRKLFLIPIGIVFFIILYLKNIDSQKNNIIETIENDLTSNKSLYYKDIYINNIHRKIFFALSIKDAETDKFIQKENATKLHSSYFWDPVRCAGMPTIFTDNEIIFAENIYNEKTEKIETSIYTFNLNNKTLNKSHSPYSIEKFYKKDGKIYLLTNMLNEFYIYEVNGGDFKIVEKLKTNKYDKFISTSETLKFCNKDSASCLEYKEYTNKIFDDFKIYTDINGSVLDEKTNVKLLNLGPQAKSDYYIIGIN